MNSELTTWLDYSKLQLAAEAFLDKVTPVNPLLKVLQDGNKHASKFTPTEAAAFQKRYEVIAHKPNTGTGFSGTLFWDKFEHKYTLSFRSTEFVEDVLADSVGTNEGISSYGWAFGQIADMEDWWKELNERPDFAGKPVTVTGYSLGGHLATAFAQLRAEAGELSRIQRIYTFNGAGTGGIKEGRTLTEVMALFRTVWDTGAMPEAMNNLIDIILLRSKAQRNLDNLRAEKSTITNYVSGLPGSEPLQPRLGEFDNYNLHLAMAVAGEWTTGALGHSINGGTLDASLFDPDKAPTGGMQFNGLMTELLGAGISVVAVAGLRHTNDRTQIEIEDQPLVRGNPNRGMPTLTTGVRLTNEYAKNDLGDTHSLVLIIDSLAVMDVLARLDQNPARIDNAFATQLIRSASWRIRDFEVGGQGHAEGDPLEILVDALHRLFLRDSHHPCLPGLEIL
jgi:pimeloyl-ACP methyl ester carboxylesterase